MAFISADDLFGDDRPTPLQWSWGCAFAMLWNSVQAVKSGRTWFWRRVVRFLREHEPEAFQ